MLRLALLLALPALSLIQPPPAQAQEETSNPELRAAEPPGAQGGYDIRREFDGYYVDPRPQVNDGSGE